MESSDRLARNERAMLQATRLGSLSALLSFIATVVLAFLAVRQEQATFDSNLYTRQIELAGDFVAKHISVIDAVAGLEGANQPLMNAQRVTAVLDDFGRSASAASMVMPARLACAFDRLVNDTNKLVFDTLARGDHSVPAGSLNSVQEQQHQISDCMRGALRKTGIISAEKVSSCRLTMPDPSPEECG